MKLNETPLVITDIETTGGRYFSNRIIEIGMIKVVNGEKIDEFESLIDPQCQIPDNITILTGITNDMVRQAPTFRSLHEKIYEFLDGSIFVAHNARFDYGFIKHEFEQAGIRYHAKVLCSLRLSRKLFPRFKRHDLSSIMERYNIQIENRHRALDDAKGVWGFLQAVQDQIPVDKQMSVIQEITKKPSLPARLKTDIEDIPEAPGVYTFLDEGKVPVYIGKAKNLRNRVMSHFTQTLHSNKEMDLSRNMTEITFTQTHGELAALLLESYYIKTQSPIYNRRSRRNWQLTALKLDDTGEYHKLYYEGHERIDKDDLKNIVAIFRTKRDVQRYLDKIFKEFNLCKTFLSLEKSKEGAACFHYQLKQCKGACIGEENALKYNLRLKQALMDQQRLVWPFDGMVMIEEHNFDKTEGEVIVIDHWIIQEAFRYNRDEKINLFPCNHLFDFDAFCIVYGYIHRRKNVNIKIIQSIEPTESLMESV
ncbi:MAG: 3'-5' exoribonuclease [Candidatus Omnitrophica bacterium]|nr:3'-5' exoribonuclease [Candidatus Omnitrophota bacterium]